jgi:hypothetical protein
MPYFPSALREALVRGSQEPPHFIYPANGPTLYMVVDRRAASLDMDSSGPSCQGAENAQNSRRSEGSQIITPKRGGTRQARGQMTVFSAVASPTLRWKVDRAFFLSMGLAILAENVLGFTRVFLKTNQAEQLHSDWVKVHAIAFAGWVLLFVLQAGLIASRRLDIHRRVGIGGIALAALMVGLTIISGISSYLHYPQRTALEHVMTDVFVHVAVFIFAGFVTAGILLRKKNPEYHKRLMLLATMAVGLRWPPYIVHLLFGVTLPAYFEPIGYVLAAIVFEGLVYGRVNPVFIWGLGVFLIVPPSVAWIFHTAVPQLTVNSLF